MADKASVYEHGQTAFVLNGHLKVMLEEDYLSLQKYNSLPLVGRAREGGNYHNALPATHSIASQIVKEIILPEIEKEVNTGKNFATLRQIYNSLILASWYKNNLKESLISRVYADKSTVKGVDLSDLSAKGRIYQQYLKAYKKGVFNYIKEYPQGDGQIIPRKYFSGGFGVAHNFLKRFTDVTPISQAMITASLNTIGEDYDLSTALYLNQSKDPAMEVRNLPPNNRVVITAPLLYFRDFDIYVNYHKSPWEKEHHVTIWKKVHKLVKGDGIRHVPVSKMQQEYRILERLFHNEWPLYYKKGEKKITVFFENGVPYARNDSGPGNYLQFLGDGKIEPALRSVHAPSGFSPVELKLDLEQQRPGQFENRMIGEIPLLSEAPIRNQLGAVIFLNGFYFDEARLLAAYDGPHMQGLAIELFDGNPFPAGIILLNGNDSSLVRHYVERQRKQAMLVHHPFPQEMILTGIKLEIDSDHQTVWIKPDAAMTAEKGLNRIKKVLSQVGSIEYSVRDSAGNVVKRENGFNGAYSYVNVKIAKGKDSFYRLQFYGFKNIAPRDANKLISMMKELLPGFTFSIGNRDPKRERGRWEIDIHFLKNAPAVQVQLEHRLEEPTAADKFEMVTEPRDVYPGERYKIGLNQTLLLSDKEGKKLFYVDYYQAHWEKKPHVRVWIKEFVPEEGGRAVLTGNIIVGELEPENPDFNKPLDRKGVKIFFENNEYYVQNNRPEGYINVSEIPSIHDEAMNSVGPTQYLVKRINEAGLVENKWVKSYERNSIEGFVLANRKYFRDNIKTIEKILRTNTKEIAPYRLILALAVSYMPEMYEQFIDLFISKIVSPKDSEHSEPNIQVKVACITALFEMGDSNPVLRPRIKQVFDSFYIPVNRTEIDKKLKHWKILDQATVANPERLSPGGIDLNTSNGMQTVIKNGDGVEMDVDPATIARIQREGISSLTPHIFKMTEIRSVRRLAGLQEAQ